MKFDLIPYAEKLVQDMQFWLTLDIDDRPSPHSDEMAEWVGSAYAVLTIELADV